MYIPIILGTARIGRYSEKVADYILKMAKKDGLESEILDVRDYRLEQTDDTREPEQAKRLLKIVEKADAIIIVSPEYNHSYPGELKMMLDLLFDEYKGIPVGICSVSKGNFGGIRMTAKLINLVVTLKMIPTSVNLIFPNVRELFEENGDIKDDAYEKRAGKFFNELKEYASCSLKNK